MRRIGWLLAALAVSIGCGRTELFAQSDALEQDHEVADLVPNECGGTKLLSATPLTACGVCGLWACNGLDALKCDDPGANTCGDCGPLPEEQCNDLDDDCDGLIDEGCVKKLAWFVTQEVRVHISGDHVVFDAQYLNNVEDVVLVTISTGQVEVLTPHANPIHGPGDPSQERDSAIDGNLVVWIRRGATEQGYVEGYDVATGQYLLPPDPAPTGLRPAIDAGRIVYQSAEPSQDWDIRLWQPEQGTVQVLTEPGTHEMAPDLSGPWLVFEQAPPGGQIFERHIVALNLDTDQQVTLSEGLEGWHVAPAIYSTHVVWHRESGNGSPAYQGDVFHYDLATGARTMLSTDNIAFNPRVSGSLVCWSTTNSLGPWGGQWVTGGVTLHDLATGQQQEMVSDAHLCDVDGLSQPRRLVWLERRAGLDPYLRELLAGEP